MEKWLFAIKHLWPSTIGFGRYCMEHPSFALRLFAARLRYFLTRGFTPLLAPGGFELDTPDSLIAFWVIVVERELYHSSWVDAFQSSAQPLVLDVGANAGVFSYWVHTLNPQSEIIAFEPLPVLAAKLHGLKHKTGINLICHEVALSNQTGQAILQTEHGYDGTSRLGSDPEGKGLRVRLAKLDDFVAPEISLIKIDVEGFEAEVLEGAQRTLSDTTAVIVECHNSHQKKRIVTALGSGWKELRLGPCDYLFMRSK